MFWIKLITTVTITVKSSKPDNVLINVVVVIMTRSQVPEQQCLKNVNRWRQKQQLIDKLKNQLRDYFVHTIRELQGNDSMSQAII